MVGPFSLMISSLPQARSFLNRMTTAFGVPRGLMFGVCTVISMLNTLADWAQVKWRVTDVCWFIQSLHPGPLDSWILCFFKNQWINDGSDGSWSQTDPSIFFSTTVRWIPIAVEWAAWTIHSIQHDRWLDSLARASYFFSTPEMPRYIVSVTVLWLSCGTTACSDRNLSASIDLPPVKGTLSWDLRNQL